jgi:hypothetical protein
MGESPLTQTRIARGVRRRASLCPTRPATPEVAGSSPVVPVSLSLVRQSSASAGSGRRLMRSGAVMKTATQLATVAAAALRLNAIV